MDSFIRYPAEWEPHRAVWLAWPSHAELWGGALPEVRREFVELCRAIADVDPETGNPRGEALWVLVPNAAREREAQEALAGLGATFFRAPFGDIWLRDTGPFFLKMGDQLLASRFLFNGWGGKYLLEGDDTVGERVAEFTGIQEVQFHDWILEGGSIELDGAGNLLTTEECLLNPNRNPGMNRGEIESRLKDVLGVEQVHWLKKGLSGDHTDGHIDNLARFVGPAKVICMESSNTKDPNADILREVLEDLSLFRNDDRNPFEIRTLPSPGKVIDSDGNLMAASHVNFYIGNRVVIVPLYPDSQEDEIVSVLQDCFPDRRVVGCPAWHLLHGGGSFHCITQQVPL